MPVRRQGFTKQVLRAFAQLEDRVPTVGVQRDEALARLRLAGRTVTVCSRKSMSRHLKARSSQPRMVVLRARIIARRATCHSGLLAAVFRSFSFSSARRALPHFRPLVAA